MFSRLKARPPAVLRFQRVQCEEEKREIELHARESLETELGDGCEGVALEQLGILRACPKSLGANRCVNEKK